MSRKSIRERQRQKMRRRRIQLLTRAGICLAGIILVGIFLVRGIILPIAHRIGSNGTVDVPTETVISSDSGVQEPLMDTSDSVDASTVEKSTQAIRVPLKGTYDFAKLSTITAGWHDSTEGRWYQNADGTYYASGFQKIDGTTYSFDENGYIQTGWISQGVNDYYFNEDGSYNPDEKRPMLCLTFDDGPGQYTDTLLDCLEENGAKATFFMVGENVPNYPEAVQRMVELGCELGNHSYNHANLTSLSLEDAVSQMTRTDDELIAIVGQASTVARAPYGAGSDEIYQAVGKPFFMWSLDSLDWKYRDVQLDYDVVVNGDLTDGSIILMHDIHEASVQAALLFIPELVSQGYKFVTVSEMAEAKNVTLQNALYVDFWQSALDNGSVPGYNGAEDQLQ